MDKDKVIELLSAYIDLLKDNAKLTHENQNLAMALNGADHELDELRWKAGHFEEHIGMLAAVRELANKWTESSLIAVQRRGRAILEVLDGDKESE